jgi:hypothetical protein
VAARELEALVIGTAAKMPPRKALRFLEAYEARQAGNTPAPTLSVESDADHDASPVDPPAPSRGQSLVRRAMTSSRPKPVE